MAVGGMLGGGIYTLAGFVVGVAGPLAWLSLLLGSLIALATARSYCTLTSEVAHEGVPVTLLLVKGRSGLAGVTAWWLLLVYPLATAVYAFTFSRYVGRACGVSQGVMALLAAGVVAVLAAVNVSGIRNPEWVQRVSVWLTLVILFVLAGIGIVRWRPANLTAGVPAGSLDGVLLGMGGTFIAFEGFEMLFYDVRELRCPRRILRRVVPAAIVAVAVAYALVTVGAASLVGGGALAAASDDALAVAGAAAAGRIGLLVVTVAAAAAAVSAINATLFSVARLARAVAERRLAPGLLARVNARKSPHWAILLLAALSATLAAIASLEALVESASLAFLLLFSFVNALAFREGRSLVSFAGTVGSVVASAAVVRALLLGHPASIVAFALAAGGAVVGHLVFQSRRQSRRRVRV